MAELPQKPPLARLADCVQEGAAAAARATLFTALRAGSIEAVASASKSVPLPMLAKTTL
jgi:hypothetical protein